MDHIFTIMKILPPKINIVLVNIKYKFLVAQIKNNEIWKKNKSFKLIKMNNLRSYYVQIEQRHLVTLLTKINTSITFEYKTLKL